MKINTYLDFRGNEIKLATPEKVTTLPDSNLFVGRTCILISEKEVDETTISVGSAYYYNGEKWCHIEVEPLKIDETKINVIDDEITLRTFDTLSDAKTYINSNNKPKSVIIGSNAGVTVIGVGEFSDYTSITSITIPSSVTSIYNYAFSNCTSLKSITIPSSVTSIDYSAFKNCTALEYITIPNGITSISNGVFEGCTSLKSITIPSSVTSITSVAFKNCTSLTSITIPSSVTSIGNSVFENCTSLKSITIPSGVTSIGVSVFYGCTSLKSITIPSNVTSIEGGTFSYCTSLKSITIPSGVTSIDVGAFYGCKSITSITIPSSVTSIGVSAFYGCTSLKSITIPSSVTSIGDAVFTDCDILSLDSYKSRTGYPWGATDILIHNEDVTTTVNENSTDRQVPTAKAVYNTLSPYSLDDTKINVIDDEVIVHKFNTLASAKTYINSNNKPKSVIIGSNAGVTSIGMGAFSNCKSLTSITIPSSVTSINGAFSYCTSLTSITIPDSVTSISGNVFLGCTSLTSITIPSGVTSISDYAFNGCTSLTSITIPDSVTKIATYAFSHCTSLKSINIPSSVTSIGNGAFHTCTSLTSITIPSSVTSIGDSTFYDCASLTSITIPDSVTSIGTRAFEDCTSLKSVTIPSSVTSIGTNTFKNCKYLKSVTIPSSVTSIGANAFYNCDKLILDNYKSRTGYPWGATSILIHNEDVTTTINENSTDRQVPTAKAVQAPVARLVNDGAKNKLNHTAYTRTVNGVTYTVNDDRSITITSNGTNTQSLLYLTLNTPLAAGTYILSGCTGGSSTKYDLRVKVGNTITNNYNGGTEFSSDGTPIESSIVVRASQTLNVTIKPMICTAADYAISPSYVPYAKSNYQLTKDARSIPKLIDDGVKNLLKNTGVSRTINGVTFTVNDDGTVSVNGTNSASSSVVFYINTLPADIAPNYNGCRLTGCPQGGSTSTYRLGFQLNSGAFTSYASDTGSGSTIHDVPSSDCRVVIVVYSGTTVNNLIFKPMICTAEDYAISSEYVPYVKSNYQLTKDVGSIPKLVDDGAKNLLKNTALYGDLVRTNITFTHNDDDTYTVNATSANTANTDLYVAADIPIKAGTYILTGCPEGGNNSNAFKLQIAGIGYDLGDGFTFNIAQDTTISIYIRIWSGYIPNNLVFKPMICTTKDYVISQEFVPYAPNNRELYEEMLPFLSGRKVYEHYFGSSSGSDTFTISKSDFGSNNLSNCGIYLIYRISWSYTPAISIYAFAYSGNRADYTTLQKIAGEDFDISVAQDVLSFTTSGKIQIIAVN